MDFRWAAYLGSGLLAAASLVPVSVYQPAVPTASPANGRRAPEARSLDARMRDVDRFAARMQTFAATSPPPRSLRRDPFRFGHARVPVPASREPMVPPVQLAERAADTGPVLTLIGMAERQVADALVRTAIVSGLDDVHLVGVGDLIGGRYRVVAIGADAVELQDEAHGSTLRLGLK